jgi:hypothetical protein
MVVLGAGSSDVEGLSTPTSVLDQQPESPKANAEDPRRKTHFLKTNLALIRSSTQSISLPTTLNNARESIKTFTPSCSTISSNRLTASRGR